MNKIQCLLVLFDGPLVEFLFVFGGEAFFACQIKLAALIVKNSQWLLISPTLLLLGT